MRFLKVITKFHGCAIECFILTVDKLHKLLSNKHEVIIPSVAQNLVLYGELDSCFALIGSAIVSRWSQKRKKPNIVEQDKKPSSDSLLRYAGLR